MTRLFACLACIALIAASVGARAQTRPATSGKQSFDEPEMRRGHQGLYYPNRPHHRRHRHHGLFR